MLITLLFIIAKFYAPFALFYCENITSILTYPWTKFCRCLVPVRLPVSPLEATFQPHSLYEPMEPQEEPKDTAPTPPPSPVQAPEPVLPQEELEPKEEVVYLSDDEDDELAQDGEQPPSPPQDGSAEVGVSSLPMGWIM
jgi:hypothetical protein